MDLLWKALVICLITYSVRAKIHELHLRGDGTTLYWTLDYPNKTLNFELHIYPESRASWFAIGFSNFGGLENGDYCLYWADWRRDKHLEDVWTDDQGTIRSDDQQDCTHFLQKVDKPKNIIKIYFQRKFNTCDRNDYAVTDGTVHVVFAEGRGPINRVDGLNIKQSSTSSGFQRTTMLKNEMVIQLPPNVMPLEFLVHNVQIPAEDTTYWCTVHKLPDILKTKHHIVQYGAEITSGNEHIVHHMELFHCATKSSVQLPSYSGPCPKRPSELKVCAKVLAAWAMGAIPFQYPEEAGSPIGGADFNLNVMLEIHYDNRQLQAGIIDSSGFKIHVTPTLRKYDAGIIELGLEYIDKMAIPPKQPNFPLTGYCIPDCTAIGLPEEGITIFGSQLHAHLTGRRIWTKHFRFGKELSELNRDDHFSTHFQEIRLLKKFVKLLPGDALFTTCIFDTMDRTEMTLGGFNITDEMCVNYIHYYPKTALEVCKSSISYKALFDYFTYLQGWEGQKTDVKKPISKNFNSINWTPLRAQVLNDLYIQSPLSMQCNNSAGERFPGNWEGMPIPMELDLQTPRDECASKFYNYPKFP